MKPIRLSERQAFKLLEMCDSLFSNLNIDVCIKIDKDMDLNSYFVDFSKKTKDNQESKVTSIHWFEFCMTHLANELYNNIDYTDSSEFNINLYVDLMLDMVNFKINPIDFLYKEFLKTKTNNK